MASDEEENMDNIHSRNQELKETIATWFSSGNMSFADFQLWKIWASHSEWSLLNIEWYDQATECIALKNLLSTYWDRYGSNGYTSTEIQEFVQKYTSYNVEFVETVEPYLRITGAVIFLQQIKDDIMKYVDADKDDRKLTKVVANASKVINLDTSLILPGINVVLTAAKIKIWDEQTIDLSGHGYPAVKRAPAVDGGETEDGAEGDCGKAGESSGNCLIITDEIVNPKKLKVILNGGRGENGQPGGKGGPGKNGVGITQDEFNHVKVQYNTIYRDHDNALYNYEPPKSKNTKWQRKIYEKDEEAMLMYSEYEDQHGRRIIYSYSGYHPPNLTWLDYVLCSSKIYDLYFLVRGTDGTMGGIGGLGGFGGKGGHPATLTTTILTLTHGFDVRFAAISGADGDDGTDGEIGANGENGNDILYIDSDKRWRDTREKHWFGIENPVRIQITYKQHSSFLRRFDRYQKDVIGNDRWFAKFNPVDINSQTQNVNERQAVRRQQQQQTRTKAPLVLKNEMETAMQFIVESEATLRIVANQVEAVTQHLQQEINILIENPLIAPAQFIPENNENSDWSEDTDVDKEEWLKRIFTSELTKTEIDNFKSDLYRFKLSENERKKLEQKWIYTVKREKAKEEFERQKPPLHVKKSKTIVVKGKREYIEHVRPKIKSLNQLNSDVITKFCKADKLHSASIPLLKVAYEAWHQLDTHDWQQNQIFDLGSDYDWKNMKRAETSMDIYFPDAMNRWTGNVTPNSAILDQKRDLSVVQSILAFQTELSNKSDVYNNIFRQLRAFVDNPRNAANVFGDIPVFTDQPDEFAVAFLLKFYFQLRYMLKYQWLVYNVWKLKNSETLLPSAEVSISDFDDQATPNYLSNAVSPTEFQEICEFVNSHGLNCAAFRMLAANLLNLNIRVYGNEVYGTFELIESFNNKSKVGCQLLYQTGSKTLSFTMADIELRKLIESRMQLKSLCVDTDFNDDMQKSIELSFPEDHRSIANEWMKKYKLISKNDSLLRLLYDRFDVDGNHMSLVEFQFVLNTAMLLHQCHFSTKFIVMAALATPQENLIDVFLHLRIETVWRRRIKGEYNNQIKKMIKEVSNAYVKSLLGMKAEEHDFDEEILLQLLGLLQTASLKSLEAMNLTQWIENARQVDIFKLRSLSSNECNDVDYYITSMINTGYLEVAKFFENMLLPNPENAVVKKLIADVAYMITNGEVNFDDRYASALRTVATQASSAECETAMRILFPTKSRDVTELLRIMKSQHKEQGRTLKTIETAIQDVNSEVMNYIDQVDKVLSEKDPPIKLRDTQKLTIVAAIKNKNILTQVKTGEGKTFIIAAIAIIRAKMCNQSVDIITSSSVLAERDCKDLEPLYKAFGLTVGHICDEDIEKRKLAYRSNIVYGDISRFQRDYLIHNFYKNDRYHGRTQEAVIIDEVDNMLLDNGNNVLYLSHNIRGVESVNSLFVFIHECVNRTMLVAQNNNSKLKSEFDNASIKHQVMSDMLGAVVQTDLGNISDIKVIEVFEKLIKLKVIDMQGYILDDSNLLSKMSSIKTELQKIAGQKLVTHTISCLKIVCNRVKKITVPRCLFEFCFKHLDTFIENAKKSYELEHNVQYVIALDGQRTSADVKANVTILDVNTGVDLPTSQWENGLHEMVQLKHGCKVGTASLKAVFTSNVTYLKNYKFLNGLSGTLGSTAESELLVGIYDTQLLRVPTDKPRVFKETVPLLCSSQKEWIKLVFKSASDTLDQNRSALLICRSIKDVQTLKQYFLQQDRTFWTSRIITYERDSESCEFAKGLPPQKVVISTNLAGRGTDIDINMELKENGGLHVIISFLPENQRIEEQAYGRAARCGCPGSGQIIGMSDELMRGSTVNSTQLKEMRDALETVRINRMNSIYRFQTSTEESCLEKFRAFCDKSFTRESLFLLDREDFPTLVRTIYFALLDEWALWLDEKWKDINECTRTNNLELKSNIIDSVDEFTRTHPIDKYKLDKAFEWIRFPEPFITKGLIELRDGKFKEAQKSMDYVIERFPEFMGEYYYYSGVIAQKQIDSSTDRVQEVKRIENLFHIARCFFECKKEEREQLMTLISRLQILASQNQHNIDGYYRESREFESVVDIVLSNIDDIVGTRVTLDSLNFQSQNYPAIEMEKLLKKNNLITDPVVCDVITPYQLKKICNRYCISKDELTRFLENRRHAGYITKRDIEEEELLLPSAVQFWNELRNKDCFIQNTESFCYQVDPAQQHLVPEGVNLEPVYFRRRNNLVVLTTEKTKADEPKLYDKTSVEDIADYDALYKHGVFRKCSYANIDLLKLENIRELKNYSFVKKKELADILDVNEEFAQAILDKLEEADMIAEAYALKNNVSSDDDRIQAVLDVAKNGPFTKHTLLQLVPDRISKSLLTDLIKNGYLESCGYSMSKTELNFDILPECLRERVRQYLVHQFSFSIARQILIEQLKLNVGNERSFNHVFLSLDPYEELFNDLQRCGLVVPRRIIPNDNCKFEPENEKLLLELINEYKSKVDSWPMELFVSATYLNEKDVMVPRSLHLNITSSLTQVAVFNRLPYWWVNWLMRVSDYASSVTNVFGSKETSTVKEGELSPKHVLQGLTMLEKIFSVGYYRQCIIFKQTYDRSPTIGMSYSAITHYHEAACRGNLQKQKLIAIKKGMLQKISKIGAEIREMYITVVSNNEIFKEVAEKLAHAISNNPEEAQVSETHSTLSELKGTQYVQGHLNNLIGATKREFDQQLLQILEDGLQQTELNVTEVLKTLRNLSFKVPPFNNVQVNSAVEITMATYLKEIAELEKNWKFKIGTAQIGIFQRSGVPKDLAYRILLKTMDKIVGDGIFHGFLQPFWNMLNVKIEKMSVQTSIYDSTNLQNTRDQLFRHHLMTAALWKNNWIAFIDAENILHFQWSSTQSLATLRHLVEFDHAVPALSVKQITSAVSDSGRPIKLELYHYGKLAAVCRPYNDSIDPICIAVELNDAKFYVFGPEKCNTKQFGDVFNLMQQAVKPVFINRQQFKDDVLDRLIHSSSKSHYDSWKDGMNEMLTFKHPVCSLSLFQINSQ
uniref:Chloroplast protein-transporting ATPase n=1 Tax=Panagrellus redivivus TaxID=6233 RepID=A0A7E4VS27_PANRE